MIFGGAVILMLGSVISGERVRVSEFGFEVRSSGFLKRNLYFRVRVNLGYFCYYSTSM